MITARYIGDGWYELDGLSTDRKPLHYRNGTVFREIDTDKKYKYDAENRRWHAWTADSGSGGGGGGDEETATEDDIDGVIDDIWPDQT